MATGELTKKIKWGYASAAVGDSATYTFFNTFLMFFLTTLAGVDPAIAGMIAALGAFWDALLSPIVGFMSDNSTSKYGRRRSFIFVAAFPMAIITCLTFTNIGIPMNFKVIYYAVMVLLFWAAFSFFFIPYLAFGAEITDDYDGRTTLRSYAYMMNVLGMVIGMGLPTLVVDGLISGGFTLSGAWQLTAALVGLCAFISLMITWRTTKGRERVAEEGNATQAVAQAETQAQAPQELNASDAASHAAQAESAVKRMFKGYWEVLKLKPLRILVGASIFYLVANAMHTSDRMYFFTYNLGMGGAEITVMMFIIIVSGVVFVPGILKFAKRYDKRKVLMICLFVSAICMGVSRFLGISSVPGVLAFALVFALGNTSYWQLVPAMIYDICELDELLNDKRREGSVVSLQSFAEAGAAAVSMQLLGLILKFSGFNGDAAVQSGAALFWVENSFGLIPAFFILIAVFMVYKYPITKEVFGGIKDMLKRKRAGEEVDLSKIGHIL